MVADRIVGVMPPKQDIMQQCARVFSLYRQVKVAGLIWSPEFPLGLDITLMSSAEVDLFFSSYIDSLGVDVRRWKSNLVTKCI